MAWISELAALAGSLTPFHLIELLFAVPLVYFVCLIIYNLYFHPLAKFPGPKVAAASHLWYARALSQGNSPMKMSALHEVYGPVIRVAPDELSFTSPSAWKEIYGHKRSGQPELSKDKKYHAGVGEPILINAEREYHSSLRRLLSHGCSDGALRAQEELLRRYISLFIEKLEEHGANGQNSINLEHWYQYFTFDVIGHLTHGEPFDCMTTGRLHPFIKVALSFAKFLAYSQAMQRLPWILQLPYAKHYIRTKIKADMKTKDEFSSAKVNYRLKTTSTVPDFMEKLIDIYKAGKMSFNQLVGNSELLIMAGSETTATELSGLTYLLMTNPRVLEKLTQEIRTEFSSPEDITMVRVNNCRYLLACIEEGLRMYPPSPATHPRYTPPGGTTVDSHFVPGDMAVGVTILAACRSSRNFLNPDSFIPERWTGEDPTYAGDRKEAVQPFSYGPRNCIGRNLAYVEMKLILANILLKYDLENCTSEGWMDQRVFMIWEKTALNVKLKPREV